MPQGLGNSEDTRYFFALAQVGMEFVAPIVIGALLDSYLGWMPWATITGAVLGFVGGMYHLITMLNRQPPERKSRSEERHSS